MACVSTTLRCLFVLLLRVLRLVVVGVLNHSFSLSVYGNISHIYSMISIKLQLLYVQHSVAIWVCVSVCVLCIFFNMGVFYHPGGDSLTIALTKKLFCHFVY